MITDVPDHQELNETATGWLNLAWEIAIRTLSEFQETWIYYEDLEKAIGEEFSEKQQDSYWHSKRYKLNNAIALFQQSMELFLKARIAETSPYLLISGEPNAWPKPNSSGLVSFSDFKTLDALQLFRAATIAASAPLSSKFNDFYEKIRKHRNKIAHLNAGNVRVEAHKILVDILTGFDLLFPNTSWIKFRKTYMVSTGEYCGITEYDEDDTHSNFMRELDTIISALTNQHTKSFLGYDKKAKWINCPNCDALRSDWDDQVYSFAKREHDGSVKCIACESSYTSDEYRMEIGETPLDME